MTSDKRRLPDADQLYAKLLADMTDLIETHSSTAAGIAEAAITTLSTFIDPDSKDEVTLIVSKLTQRLNSLTEKMTLSRDALRADVAKALSEIDLRQDALLAAAESHGEDATLALDAADASRTSVFEKSVRELAHMVDTFRAESIAAQQGAAQAFAAIADRADSTSTADILARLYGLETAINGLPKLLRNTQDGYEDDEDLPDAPRSSTRTTGKKPSRALVPLTPSALPAVQPPSIDLDLSPSRDLVPVSANLPVPVQTQRKPSHVIDDLGDPYANMLDQDMDRRKVRALEVIADAWRKFDKDGSIGNTLDYAALGALLTALLGGLLPDLLTRFPALKLASDILKYFREGRLLSSIKEFLGTKWAKLAEWGHAIHSRTLKALDKLHDLVSPMIKAFKESPLLRKALGLADTTADAARPGIVAKAVGTIGKVTGKISAGVEAVKGTTAFKMASNVITASSNVVKRTVSATGAVASRVGGSLVRGMQAVAGSPVGNFLEKNLNRLGNLAMVMDVLTGVLEEATGKKVDDVGLLDAVLNPMKIGRFLGNKGNALFEKKMGQSVGSWLYDVLNADATVQQMTPAYTRPPSAIQAPSHTLGASSSGSTKPVKENVVPAPHKDTAVAPVGLPSLVQPGARSISSAPSLSPSSIPNFMGVDPNTGAMLFGALAR